MRTNLIGRIGCCAVLGLLAWLPSPLRGEEFATRAWRPPVCDVLPLAEHQVALRIDGIERCRWHHGPQYPRPFFFPLLGPSGEPLTRMGHPGAENHDHHRSVWFAFSDVDGLNFWADNQETKVRQNHWYAYRSGDAEALLATRLGWCDPEGQERMAMDLCAALIPLDAGQYALELQIDLKPGPGMAKVELGKTNFGFLAVRVAESISAHFGGGKLTNSEGAEGEPAIFGQPARWVDYSGPVAVGQGPDRQTVIEGITYFDHPDNPRYPTRWHVREDGWMGASFCLEHGFRLTTDEGLRLRYLLLVHRDWQTAESADRIHEAFANRPPMRVRKGRPDERHRQYVVERATAE